MESHRKIRVLTCYDYSFAQILTSTQKLDFLLVGDSAANVIYGFERTSRISLEVLLAHVGAVRRGRDRALASLPGGLDSPFPLPQIIGDLPAGTYETVEAALASSWKMREAGAESVKLEGPRLEQVRALKREGLSIWGHIGYTPQSIATAKVQGRTQEDADRLVREALELQDAGCSYLVLELVPQGLAKRITEQLSIPTIGIGAGVHCSGQVLVLYDLLGFDAQFNPKFLKKYADAPTWIRGAVDQYASEVDASVYPDPEHSFD